MTPMKTLLARAAAVAALLGAAAAAHAQVKIEAPWARPTVQGQQAGGGYLRLQSPTADRFVGASSPVAGRVELHEMAMDGDVMRMRQVDGIALAAGQAVELKPGGLHLMLMELKTPLKSGDRIPLTLKFEKAGEVKVEMPVTATAPAGAAAGHGEHKH